MFDGLNKLIGFAFFAAVVAVLSLSGWVLYQSNQIDSLTTENEKQAKTIQAQKETEKLLQATIEAERAAVAEQQKINAEIEDKANANITAVRTIIKTQRCANTRLPDGVIERLYNAKTR